MRTPTSRRRRSYATVLALSALSVFEIAAPHRVSASVAELNVRAYGATGNGVTDDTAAVQRAFNGAAAGGNAVYFPPGTYLLRTVSIPNGISRIYGQLNSDG